MCHLLRVTTIALIAAAAVAGIACSGSPSAPSVTGDVVTNNPPTSTPPPAASTRYRVVFETLWSPATHPDEFPDGAHFSPLVGGTHSNQVTFWVEGALASTGIKDMSERGRTSPLDQEINAAVAAGRAQNVFTGPSMAYVPTTSTLEFDISQTFPLVTLVTMIAPSPDWFVGVTGLALFENGQWLGERKVDLVPWDAGTDSGRTFTSADQVTSPFAAISRILSAPLSPNGKVTPLATFTFTRLN